MRMISIRGHRVVSPRGVRESATLRATFLYANICRQSQSWALRRWSPLAWWSTLTLKSMLPPYGLRYVYVVIGGAGSRQGQWIESWVHDVGGYDVLLVVIVGPVCLSYFPYADELLLFKLIEILCFYNPQTIAPISTQNAYTRARIK